MALTANRIKHSFATLLPKSNKLHAIPAESLVRIVPGSGQACYLKHKCFNTLPMRNMWKRRFVVLVNSALYIYDSETSKRPRNCIALKGYNCVRRVHQEKSCRWAFTITSDEDSLEDEFFECSSDLERREWMRNVKDSLFKANNVRQRKLSLAEQLVSEFRRAESNEEIEYELLEQPVYQVETRNQSLSNDDDLRDTVFTSECAISDDEDYGVHNQLSDEEESYEVGIWCRLRRKGAIKRRRSGVSSSTSAKKDESNI